MANNDQDKIKDLYRMYKEKIEKELGTKVESPASKKIITKEYQEFRNEYLPKHLSLYEKLCNQAEKILKVRPDAKKEQIIQKAINVCHLGVTPTGVTSFSLLAPLVLMLFGSLIFFVIFQSMFFVVIFFLIGVSIIMPLAKLPQFLADNWRLKASNQMVLSVFYVVTYMRHTSNLENAIGFAAEHLAPPLSLDLRKILWDVETETFESAKESLEAYLAIWKDTNPEFIESFHLIEASLYEGSEDRRLTSLDKALEVILEETYEKMLHYAHNLKSPITMLHMLGVILPILGLVILPLVVSFMQNIKWFHIATLYNIVLPVAIFIIGKNILSKRPTGYGDTDISEENPELKKFRNIILKIGKSEIKIPPLYLSISVAALLFFIGMLPIIMHVIDFPDMGFYEKDEKSPCGYVFCLLGYETDAEGNDIGPYGFGASLLSVAITLAFGLGIGLYYKLKSKNVIKIREKSKQLEQEFASALFQLGNRLGDNIPAEMAVGKVAESMQGTVSGNFFQLVSTNIQRLGMGVEQAIFDPKHGALVYFPSNLIESSMKVLTESVKKGPKIAAQALTNVSKYIKQIHKVNERLRDLMADIVSSMTAQVKFLTPVISGIVIGITSMIGSIIGKLGRFSVETGGGGAGMVGGMGGIEEFFKLGIPSFHFQIIVGIYVVQIVYILTVLTNGIQNGSDKLNERYMLGSNLVRGTITYSFIAFAVMGIFNFVAARIMGQSM